MTRKEQILIQAKIMVKLAQLTIKLTKENEELKEEQKILKYRLEKMQE